MSETWPNTLGKFLSDDHSFQIIPDLRRSNQPAPMVYKPQNSVLYGVQKSAFLLEDSEVSTFRNLWQAIIESDGEFDNFPVLMPGHPTDLIRGKVRIMQGGYQIKPYEGTSSIMVSFSVQLQPVLFQGRLWQEASSNFNEEYLERFRRLLVAYSTDNINELLANDPGRLAEFSTNSTDLRNIEARERTWIDGTRTYIVSSILRTSSLLRLVINVSDTDPDNDAPRNFRLKIIRKDGVVLANSQRSFASGNELRVDTSTDGRQALDIGIVIIIGELDWNI